MSPFGLLRRLCSPVPKTARGRDAHWLDSSSPLPIAPMKMAASSGAGKHSERFLKEGGVLTGSELISDLTGGANMVGGAPMHEYADDRKHDLDFMKKCCDQILKSSTSRMMPAPFYFKRVAILSRKKKNYEQEILYCEKYIKLVKSVRQSKTDLRTLNEFSHLQQVMIEPFEKRLIKARQLHSARQFSVGRAE